MLQILVVNVVERSWSDWVHVNSDSWVNFLGTSGLKFFNVGFVYGWINRVCAVEVVDSVGYFATVSEPEGVSPCMVGEDLVNAILWYIIN